MATINYDKIIEDISSRGSQAFAFPKNKYFLLLTNEEAVLNYINAAPSNWNDILSGQRPDALIKFDRSVSNVDAKYAEFQKAFYDLTNGVTSPSSFDTNSVGVIDSGATRLVFLSLSFDAKINVLQTGLGNGYDWCKVKIFDSEKDPSSYRYAVCKQEDIIKVSETTKEFIKYDFSGGILSGDIKVSKLLPKNSSLGLVINYNTQKNAVAFDDRSASYYVVIDTGIVDYSTLNDESVTAAFNVAFVKGVEQILKSNNRKLLTEKNENVWEKYLSFAYLQSYFLSSRNTQGLSVCIVIPYRNIAAATESDRSIVQNISDRTENIINNVAVVEDVISKAQEAFSIDLTKDLGNINSTIESLSASTGLSLGGYVDPSRLLVPETEELPFKNKKNEFDMEFERLYSTLATGNTIIKRFLSKEENQDSEFYIDLSIYAQAVLRVKDSLMYLLFELDPHPDYKYIHLVFNDGILADIKFNGKIGSLAATSVAPVENSLSVIENLGVDVTLSALLLNIYYINSSSYIKGVDDDVSNVVEFIKKYITPKELAEVKIHNKSTKTNKDCWDDIKSDLAKQAKKRKEKAEKASTEPVKNSVETLKKTIKDEERSQVVEDIKKAFDKKLAAGALNYKTIKWNQLIFQVTACIKDKESREFAEKALQWLKDYDTSKPLLCQVPKFTIPQFPEIKIPEIPSIYSIFSVGAQSEAELLLAARDELIKSMLQSLLDLIGFCDAPPPSDKQGETPAEDLMNNTNSSGIKAPDVSDQSQQDERRDQFLKANVFDNQDNIDEKTYETRLLLSKVSEALTKRELVLLFNGSVDNTQYDIIKTIIETLNKDGKIPNIYPSVSTKLRALNFFSRFGKLIRPDVYESLTRQEPTSTSYDTRFLCKDQTEYESSLIDDLIKRGLSEEQAAAEIYKRRDDLRKLVDNFTKTVDLLNKQEVKVQPANCVKNPDGSVTPGSTAKAGLPDPIKRLNEKLNDELFIGFEKAYSEEIKNFTSEASEKDVVSSRDKSNNTIITNTSKYLKAPIGKSKGEGFLANQMDEPFVRYSTKIITSFGSYRKDEKEKYTDEEKNPYYVLFNISNPIFVRNNISYLTSSTGIESSSVTISIDSIAEKDFPPEIPDEEKTNLINQLSFNGSYTTSSAVSVPYDLTSFYNGTPFKLSMADGYTKYLRSMLSSDQSIREYQSSTYGNVIITDFINKYIFNVPYSNVDRKNNIKDYRLINNITENKKNILGSLNEPCNIPETNPDGTKKLSNSDKKTISAAYDLLLRLYAIQYNIFILPFTEYIQYMQNGIFTYACYASFIQDIKNIYGQQFIDNMFVYLGDEYKQKKGLETINTTLEQTRFEIFKEYFEEKHLKAVNKQINEYIYEKNQDNKDLLSVQNNNISYTYKFSQIINQKAKEYNDFNPLKSIADYEFFKNLHEYIYGEIVTNKMLTISVKQEDIITNEITTLRPSKDINVIGFTIGTQSKSVNKNAKYYLEVDVTYSITPPPLPPPKTNDPTDDTRQRLIEIGVDPDKVPPDDKSLPPTTINIFSTEISYESATKLLNKQYIPELKDAQKAYSDIFTYNISLESIYSGFMSAFLLSIASIRTYNGLFEQSKSELAGIFNVLQKANDYKFDADENIFAYIKTMVKLGAKASIAMAKGVAKQSDMNAAASFRISEAYDLVFGLATSLKVDKYLPVKHIPAYLPSAALSLIIPPLTPLAAVAIGSTVTEDVLNGGGSNAASDAAKRKK